MIQSCQVLFRPNDCGGKSAAGGGTGLPPDERSGVT
jgi:hypothetical protein